jgi:hypothetical protein
MAPPIKYHICLREDERAELRHITTEIHYTPKHGSSLNMAKLELSVLNRQCLSRRLPDKETAAAEVKGWEAA